MALQDWLRIELLHGLGWTVFHRQTTHLWRRSIDPANLVLPIDVNRGGAFVTPGDDRDLAFGRIFGPLDILAIDDDTFDHSVNFKFTFPEETLRSHLEASDRVAAVVVDDLMTAFLDEASAFGAALELFVDSRQAVAASMPVVRSVFQPPQHFEKAVGALCQSGFCTETADGYLWADSVRPFMEVAGLWIGNRTKDEVREDELIEIWKTMPIRLKSLLTKGSNGGLDVLSLAVAMSQFWYGGKWHEEPLNKGETSSDIILKGGHIPTAKEIARLYSSGKLTD